MVAVAPQSKRRSPKLQQGSARVNLHRASQRGSTRAPFTMQLEGSKRDTAAERKQTGAAKERKREVTVFFFAPVPSLTPLRSSSYTILGANPGASNGSCAQYAVDSTIARGRLNRACCRSMRTTQCDKKA